jgi:outer membrane protein OmpA-like peptidoglycan-associated protein
VSTRSRRILRGATGALIVALPIAACGPSAPCRPQTYSGTCELQNMTKIQERSLPVPQVVYQSLWRPLPGQGGASMVPPDAQLEHHALAKHELVLVDFLQQHRQVPCFEREATQGSCHAGPLFVQLPEFDPNRVAATQAPAGPVGCARIEGSAEPPPDIGQASAAVGDEIRFAEGVAILDDRSRQIADQVALRLSADPGVDCVGVVGQVAPGESLGLAEERARAVRQYLVSRGVDPSRLTTITATERVFGAGARPGETDPKLRRVYLRVLLRSGP